MGKLKPVEQNPNFPELEKQLLTWWYDSGIIAKYLHKNDGAENRFSFQDGPITANNPMGVHHAWGRTLKDVWQKFYNLLGYEQRFINGFDNQGLWVEVTVEKEKGFKSKKDIEAYGMAKFVQDCKDATYKWSLVQTEQSKRLGYFMDWENSYYTMSEENNYMIWTFLKKCFEKGYIYKGRDVLPWCPRCGTAISQHEILTEAYKELHDEAVYFKLKIKGRDNEYLLVWTTTPWTLVADVAVAVGDELDYRKVKQNGEILYVVDSRADAALIGEFETMGVVKGADLIGLEYIPLYTSEDIPALADYKPQYKVVSGGMTIPISEEEGTGMVHIAPGCGAEDYQLGVELELDKIAPLDENGVYVGEWGFLTGKYAHDVNDEVFADLEKKGYLYRHEEYSHRYPMCWRCSTKLVFRLVDEWYISMDQLRYDMMEVAKQINWMPSYGLERELDWLKNMHDWCISKKRYWGLALPIWTCDECKHFEVIGDKEELKERAVEGWDRFEGQTPHKPYIDEVKIACPKCGKTMSRIPDVGNPWLDAGIVPFSTIKYREDKKYWEKWFPTDFVTECFPGQFKNWFYALIAMSTVLENKPPFKNLLGHALVRDENGEEMHKSKGNYIAFDDAAATVGSDLIRWMFLKQNPSLDILFGYNVANEIKKNFYLILWNTYKYFVTYSELSDFKLSGKSVEELELTIIDRWILSRLNGMIKQVEANMRNYDATTCTKLIEDFVNDLSTWYIRRSRDRFADLDPVALEILYHSLKNLVIVLSMYLPFLPEIIYQNIVVNLDPNAKESVHLESYPAVNEKFINEQLEREMSDVKMLSSLGQSIRVENALKIRQPLAQLYVKGVSLSDELMAVLLEELNVKSGTVVNEIPEFMGVISVEDKGLVIAIDTNISEELKKEGQLREIVRSIQNERKKSGLVVGEKVAVVLKGDATMIAVALESADSIMAQVYANSISEKESAEKLDTKEIVVEL